MYIDYSSFVVQSKEYQIDSLMLKLLNREQFNGSVLVAENGKVIYKKGFGKANIQESLDFTPGTLTYLASLTKQFTAMAIMMLAENKKLSYDDELSKYFSEFPPYADKVTIKILLNHTSGIPDYFSLGLVHQGLDNDKVFNSLKKIDALHFQPGDKFEYSNSGYVLLAMIIEMVSGLPYSIFLKRNIFDPLNMRCTFVYDTTKADIKQKARGYDIFGNVYEYDILTTGDGGIYSTVEDLFKWDQALYTEKIVKHSTLNEAFEASVLNDGSISNYGFGWEIIEYNGKKIVTHAGEFKGFNTFIVRQITDHNTIILLTNIGGTKRKEIKDALLDLLEGRTYTLPKLSIAREMYIKLRKSDIGHVVQFFDSVKKSNDTLYDINENEINLLGYQLLQENRINEAIEVFKKNTETFPSSSNAYKSLGESYISYGKQELAILSFKKSLEIDPKNSDLAQMMKPLVR